MIYVILFADKFSTGWYASRYTHESFSEAVEFGRELAKQPHIRKVRVRDVKSFDEVHALLIDLMKRDMAQ